MKTLFLSLTLVLAPVVVAQDNVTFVHGLNGDASSWSVADTWFKNLFEINSQRIQYSSTPNISTIASTKYPALLDSTIVVAHSMGGLVAREMVRKNANGKIRAMVTVGTPHTGAKGAELPGSQQAASMIGWWAADLAAPWVALLFPNAGPIGASYVYSIVGNLAQELVNDVFGGSSVQDMRAKSSFLRTLNASSASTFPDAHYVLWSREDWNMQFRLVDAMKDGKEDGNVMAAAAYVFGWYMVGYFEAKRLAEIHYNEWLETRRLVYFERYLFWLSVAYAFRDGAIAIGWQGQADWNVTVVGVPAASLDSDGIVRVASQRPSFVSEKRWIHISDEVNHFEQRTHASALRAIKRALTKSDIDVTAPLRASIAGPSTLAAGRVGTWTAVITGGKRPFTFDWDYRLICVDSGAWAADIPCGVWHDGGSSAKFSHRVKSSAFDLDIRLTVKDSKDKSVTETKRVIIN